MDLQTIKDLFHEETGLDLASKVDDLGNELMNDERFIKNQCKLITTFIKKWNYNFEYDKLNETRKSQFNEIIVEQMLFTLENGDLSTWNGIDITTGQTFEADKIVERSISPLVKDMLLTNGFLTRGIVW